MDSYGEATKTKIETEYGPNIYVSQKVSNKSLNNDLPLGVVIKLERESPDTQSHNRYQSEGFRERYRASSREKRYNDDRRGFHKDNFSSKERNRNDNSHQSKHCRDYSTDISRSREKRYDDDERRHHKDRYSYKERSRNYDDSYQSEDSRDRGRGKRYDDHRNSYNKDYSSKDRSKTYQNYQRDEKTKHGIVIKQERASQESESYTDNTDRYSGRSRSREMRHYDYKNAHNKYLHKESSDKHDRRESNQENYSTVKDIKQEIELPKDDSYDNSECSRKRFKERSSSKEKRHKGNPKKHKKDKRSARSKEHETRTVPSPGRLIKQERVSP